MKHLDTSCKVIIFITFVVFFLALFTGGFINKLLLEIGVLLISIKLIMMSYKNSIYVENVHNELQEIKEMIKKDKASWNVT